MEAGSGKEKEIRFYGGSQTGVEESSGGTPEEITEVK